MYYIICSFVCVCIVLLGQGPSKKAAKHQAAEAALTILQIDAGNMWVEMKLLLKLNWLESFKLEKKISNVNICLLW